MSTAVPQSVGEKLDLSKYFRVFRRRIWWGIVPFVLLAIVFGVICLAVPPKYRSSCLIRASRSEVADILTGTRRRARTSQAVVREQMLRYDHVMRALSKTELITEIEKQSENDPDLRARLEDDLYRRVVKHIQIGARGGRFIRVNYLGDTPKRAFAVLNHLTTDFVEFALAQERDHAGRARNMAQKELQTWWDKRDRLEARIAKFREDHPAVSPEGESGVREIHQDTLRERERLEREISRKERKLERYREQLEHMPTRIVEPTEKMERVEVRVHRERLARLRSHLASELRRKTRKHPDIRNLEEEIEAAQQQLAADEQLGAEDHIRLIVNAQRQVIEDRMLELDSDLEGDQETKRRLERQVQRHEELVVALPGLQRELAELRRDRADAENRYDRALTEFRRIDKDFNTTMEGLVSFRILDPAREPRRPDVKHKVRLALMGLFIALVAGMGAIAGTEFLDQSFTDIDAARGFLRLPSLGIIPLIETRGDRRRRRLKIIFITLSVILLVAALVLTVWLAKPVRGWAEQLWEWIRYACKNLV